MGKRLSENLSSLYIGAANKLKPKCSRRKIIAYVESYDDISFWRTLLGEYENETRYFEVMLPSKTTLAKGKKSVLMNELGPRLGQNMIACENNMTKEEVNAIIDKCTNHKVLGLFGEETVNVLKVNLMLDKII